MPPEAAFRRQKLRGLRWSKQESADFERISAAIHNYSICIRLTGGFASVVARRRLVGRPHGVFALPLGHGPDTIKDTVNQALQTPPTTRPKAVKKALEFSHASNWNGVKTRGAELSGRHERPDSNGFAAGTGTDRAVAPAGVLGRAGISDVEIGGETSGRKIPDLLRSRPRPRQTD